MRPLGLPQVLPLLARLHPPVLPLRRHCRPHLHRLHNLTPAAAAAATSGLLARQQLRLVVATTTALRPAYADLARGILQIWALALARRGSILRTRRNGLLKHL